jgi:DNA repair exonuclease SbcCD ATPase subunit
MPIDIHPPADLHLPPSLPEPPPAAREAWPKLDSAMAKLDELRTRQSQLGGEAQVLAEGLEAARERDRVTLGRALAAGEEEPESETEALEAEIARLNRHAQALSAAIADELEKVAKLVERSKESWQADIECRLVDRAAAYRVAIAAMAEARAALEAEVHMAAWLATFPESGPQPQTGLLLKDELLRDERRQSFEEIVRDLQRDVEALPAAGPVPLGEDFERMLARHHGFAGKEGERTVWVQGASPAEWAARDVVAEIKRKVRGGN